MSLTQEDAEQIAKRYERETDMENVDTVKYQLREKNLAHDKTVFHSTGTPLENNKKFSNLFLILWLLSFLSILIINVYSFFVPPFPIFITASFILSIVSFISLLGAAR